MAGLQAVLQAFKPGLVEPEPKPVKLDAFDSAPHKTQEP
jgi:hypothetical protein